MPVKCHFCAMRNPPDSMSCTNCGKPLDVKSAERLDEKQETEIQKHIS